MFDCSRHESVTACSFLHSTIRDGGQPALVLITQHTVVLSLEEVKELLLHGRNDWIDLTERPLLVASFVAVMVGTALDTACSRHDEVVPPTAPTPHSHNTLGWSRTMQMC